MASRLFARCAMAVFACGFALAQEGPEIAPPASAAPIPTSEDPPGRAARLSYITARFPFSREEWRIGFPRRRIVR